MPTVTIGNITGPIIQLLQRHLSEASHNANAKCNKITDFYDLLRATSARCGKESGAQLKSIPTVILLNQTTLLVLYKFKLQIAPTSTPTQSE